MRNKPYPLYSNPKIKDLKDMIEKRAVQTPDDIAFTYSKGRNEIIHKTCLTFKKDIDSLGTYLYKKGFVNSNIAIVGENSYEWLVTFFAVTNGGNVAVPLDKALNKDSIRKLLKQSDCCAVAVSEGYYELVEGIENLHIINLSDLEKYVSDGESYIADGFRNYINHSVDLDKKAVIAYTSGTTGISRGVMLSQKNIVADINNGCKNFTPGKKTFAVLPMHHMFGLVVGTIMPFYYNCEIFINKSLKKILPELSVAKPNTTFLVPLFIETFYKQIWNTAKTGGKDKKLKTAMKFSNMLMKLGIDVRKQLFSSVRSAFGGDLEYILCGGAPLNPKYIKEFRTWGIEILNAYGITECSPGIAVNRNFYHKDGSAGLPIENCTVKIADDGEIIVKGDNVMIGYYKDTSATESVLYDGWYHTGDLGHIDKDGFLFITGRKKNLIILSNGENVSPEEIETRIYDDANVCEAVVYDENELIIAEIYPTEAYLGNQSYFEELMQTINNNQPMYKQVNIVRLRNTEFPKNTSKKILRHKIREEKNDK